MFRLSVDARDDIFRREIRVQDGHHPVLRGSNEVSFIVRVVLQRLRAIERAIKNREEFSNRVNCGCSSVVVLHLEQSELYHHTRTGSDEFSTVKQLENINDGYILSHNYESRFE
jgi:hypothetical protein|tara:strand:- start:210 stop:551 length:342 start_codon:yes stop_codon:yes gene_type:complete